MKPASGQNRAVQKSWRIRVAWMAALCFTASGGAMAARAFTAADADTIFETHAMAFYRVMDDRAWFTQTTEGGKADYWTQVEQLEMVLDA